MEILPTGRSPASQRKRRKDKYVTAQPVMTAEELVEFIRHAAPPTSDDVPITCDGRRLDSPDAVKEWLADLAARRAAGDVDASA